MMENLKLPKLDSKFLKEVSQISTWRGLTQVAIEWTLIASAIFLCWQYFSIPAYLLTLIFIGSRMHALGVLMHDASHYRLAKSRIVNEVVGELLIAWPFFFTMSSFRRNHLRHHIHLNTEHDPDYVRKVNDPENWQFPRPRKEVLMLFLKDVLGLNTLLTFKDIRLAAKATSEKPSPYMVAAKALYYLLLFSTIHLLGGWKIYLLFWLIPGFTTLRLALHLRAVGEHLALPQEKGKFYTQSRTLKLAWWERFLLAPLNIEHHVEHHIFPSVPFYHLPRLHRELMKDPTYRQNLHLTRGYKGLLQECSSVIDRLNRV